MEWEQPCSSKTNLTAKELAKEFAKVEKDFDSACRDFMAARYQLKDDWRDKDMLEWLHVLSYKIEYLTKRLRLLEKFKDCYNFWHKDDVPEIHGWTKEEVR